MNEWIINFDFRLSTSSLKVRYNTLLNTKGIDINVNKIIMHPEYVSSNADNDIGILHLSSSLNIGQKNAGTMCLPEAGDDFGEGEEAEVSGWGHLEYNGDSPTQLQTVTVPGVSRQKCKQAYNEYYGEGEITDNIICAGLFDQRGKDSCQVIYQKIIQIHSLFIFIN